MSSLDIYEGMIWLVVLVLECEIWVDYVVEFIAIFGASGRQKKRWLVGRFFSFICMYCHRWNVTCRL